MLRVKRSLPDVGVHQLPDGRDLRVGVGIPNLAEAGGGRVVDPAAILEHGQERRARGDQHEHVPDADPQDIHRSPPARLAAHSNGPSVPSDVCRVHGIFSLSLAAIGRVAAAIRFNGDAARNQSTRTRRDDRVCSRAFARCRSRRRRHAIAAASASSRR